MEDQRAVSREQGEKMAEEYNMAYIETSAKTGEGCSDAFENMAELLIQVRIKEEADKKPAGDYEYDGRSFSL